MVAAGHGIDLLPELAVSGQLAQLHGMQVKTFVNPRPRVHRRRMAQIEHPRHLIDAIVASIRGVQIREHTEVTGFAGDRGRARALLLAHDSLPAEAFVVATGAWARAPPPALATGAGYVTLAGGIHADRLVAAQLDGVARIEFHESSLDGGIARMRQLPSVAIPANHGCVLAPGCT